jgi:hypothetical protein
MWWPGHIPAGVQYGEMMSHIDCWATLAAMVGLTPPPADWIDDNGKPIYFDSIDNSSYILGQSQHSARKSWVYIDGAAPARTLTSSPGRYAGQDNGWVLSLIEPVMLEFDQTLMKYPKT